jgi:DNA-binding transcriptional LysR family regulator
VTAPGREFAAMAKRVLADLKLSLSDLRELSERQRGQIFVTSLMSLSMSSIVAEFNCRFPGIEIYLREGFEDDVKEDVRSGVVDCAAALATLQHCVGAVPTPSCVSTIAEKEFCCVCSLHLHVPRSRECGDTVCFLRAFARVDSVVGRRT